MQISHVVKIQKLAEAILEEPNTVEIYTLAREILFEVQRYKDKEAKKWLGENFVRAE